MSSLDEIARHEKFAQIQKEKVRLYHWPSPQYLLDDSFKPSSQFSCADAAVGKRPIF